MFLSGYLFIISLTELIDDSRALSKEVKSKSIREYFSDFFSSFGIIVSQK
jgi:hypothetical protein